MIMDLFLNFGVAGFGDLEDGATFGAFDFVLHRNIIARKVLRRCDIMIMYR